MKQKILSQITKAKIVIHERIGKQMLFLDITLPGGNGTVQYLPVIWAETLMNDYKVDELAKLEGKPIWVDSEGVGSLVRVIGVWKIE
mgnify:CR=1 FL=1